MAVFPLDCSGVDLDAGLVALLPALSFQFAEHVTGSEELLEAKGPNSFGVQEMRPGQLWLVCSDLIRFVEFTLVYIVQFTSASR